MKIPEASIEKEDLDALFKIPEVKSLRGSHPTILEIGTWHGGSAFIWNDTFDPDVLISIDKEKSEDFIAYKPKRKTQYVNYIFKRSQEDETHEVVVGLLKKRKVDFLFIDGDHSYEGVTQDFRLYAPLVKKGGVIVFHDISYHADGTEEVDIFWNELKGKHKHVEIKSSPNSTGMGVLFV